jgi:hypothetical protein
MKIRQGFVSNSSSTSFTIFGIQSDFDFDEFLKAKLVTKKQRDDIENDSRSLFESIKQKLPNGFDIIYSYDDNDIYIGRDAKSIQDNETGLEFKQSAQEFLESIFGRHIKCEWIEETVEN